MKLIMILKKNGVSYYKDKDVELQLNLDDNKSAKNNYQADQLQASRPNIQESENKEDQQQTMTEDDFLYWSSGFDPREMNKPSDPSNQ